MYNNAPLDIALHIIKHECNKHASCNNCPLYNNYYLQCGVKITAPDGWDLKSDHNNNQESLFEWEE